MDKSKFKKGSTILGIIGGSLVTIVSFVFYFVALGGGFGENNNNGLALGILFGGLLGGIMAIIISCFVKYSRLVAPIIQLVAFAAVSAVTIMVIMSNSSNTGIMIILPFFVVPDALILTAGIMGLLPAEIPDKKVESKPEDK